MKFSEFKELVKNNYNEIFPKSACSISLGALGGDSAFIRYYLAGEQSEFPNNIAGNDLFHIMFCVRQTVTDEYGYSKKLEDDMELPDKLVLDVQQKTIATKPDNDYLAYGSISLPFRRTVGTPEKIIDTLKRYAEIVKKTLTELYEEEALPVNQQPNIVEFVASKLGISETKKTEGYEITGTWDPHPEIGKSYAYRLKHGLGGTLPDDVKIKKYDELNGGRWVIVYLDRPLTKEELDLYDIPSETISMPEIDKFIDYKCMKGESKLQEDNEFGDYDFSIVLNTSNPNADEFKKLTHHMEYLVNLDEAEYPTSFYNVTVETDNNSVIIKGEVEIGMFEDNLTDDDVADYLANLIDESGYADLDVILASVSVTKYVGESRDHKLTEADDEVELQDADSEYTIDREEEPYGELEDVLNDFKNIDSFHEFVVDDLIDSSVDYEDNLLINRLKNRCDSVLSSGCVSGIVGSLVYYSDTVAVFDKYADDIYDLIEDYGPDEFLDNLKAHVNTTEIVLNCDTAKNWIVWIAYEDLVYQLSNILEGL